MTYNYEKTNVNCETLKFEINHNSTITTELQSVSFKEPNSLKIDFVGTLSSEEETELDSVVSAHEGQALQGYRFYCTDCEDYKSIRYDAVPAKCPECDGTNINDIIEHDPPTISTIDELGQSWDLFILSDGSIITARRY